MKLKALLACAASLAVAGCATPGLIGAEGQRAISPQTAQQAAQQHPQVVAEFGGEIGGAQSAYVDQVGRRVAARTGVTGGGAGAFNFTALNSPVMNAFAIPGGYIYITRQLLGLMGSEAELASVMGHEIGHITADHSAARQNRGLLAQIPAILVGVLTGSGELAQLAGTFSQTFVLRYSREQELESDRLGIRYMTAAGYDPLGAPAILASLGLWSSMEARFSGRQEDQRAIPEWARSHPLFENRVPIATQIARETGQAGQGIVNRDQHLAIVDGMVFGDDPEQGVVEGRNFLHPDLRFAFTVPQGYGIQNGTRAVGVIGQQGQAQFSNCPGQSSLGDCIAQVYRNLGGQQAQIPFQQPQGTTINGIPTAWSTARVQAQQGNVDVSVFAYQFGSGRNFYFATITPAGSGLGPFDSMVRSVRQLSAAEAAAIRPRVIDVVTVGPNDTVRSLAGRMAYQDYQLERFLALNGFEAERGLRAGERVKIVVYGRR